MAFTILMDAYKMLKITQNKVLYQGENLVDQMQILVPQYYEDNDLTKFTAALEYVDAAGNAHLDILVPDEDLYKENYIRYTLPLTTHITHMAGEVKLQLTFNYVNPDELVQYTLHSSEITTEIHPVSDYYMFSDSSLNKIDQLIGELGAKVDYLSEAATILTTKIPDDLDYNEEDGKLHLSVKTHTIGHGQNVGTVEIFDDEDSVVDGIVNLDEIYKEVTL